MNKNIPDFKKINGLGMNILRDKTKVLIRNEKLNPCSVEYKGSLFCL